MSIFLGNLFEGFVEGATSNELSVLEGVAKQAKKDYDNAKIAYDKVNKAYDNAKKAYGNAKTASAKTIMDSTKGIVQNAKGVLDAKKNALDAANKAVADYKKQSKSGSKKSKSGKKESKSKSGKKKSKSKSKKSKSKKNKSKKNKSKKNKSKKKKSKKKKSKKNKSKKSDKNDLKKCNRDKTQCGLDLGTEKQKVVKLTEDNNRLISKNNSLLDTVQYYRKNLFGSSSILGSMLGYKDATIQANQEIDQLKHKEVGPEQGPPPQRQGFTTMEGYDSIDAAYKSVATQNAALENQINTKRNNYSVDDQLYTNMAGKRNTLIYVNSILMWVFYAVVTACSIYIAIDPTMSTEKKFVVFKLVWLFVVILEIAEYLLYYALQYAKAFLTGVPYSFENYWTYTLTF
jgi:hypothetical protein